MALTPRLEFRQAQSLTLTPQLMQSIRLLQLSHLELDLFVEAELQRNPLLERDSDDDSEPVDAPEGDSDAGSYEDTVDHGDRIQSAEGIAGGYDTEVENVFPDQGVERTATLASRQEHLSSGAEGADLDQFVAMRPTLAEHLSQEAGLLLHDPAERLIGRFLIDAVDASGYLAVPLETVAEQLGTTVAAVEAVLKTLQAAGPTGVFARDVRECLMLQLKERDRLDPLMQRLVDNLPLVASHDLTGLMRVVGADREDILDMLSELRQLDPRPGRGFEPATVEAIVPDVFVREARGGGWAIELNSDVLPKVLVNRSYYAAISKKTRDAAEKTFVTECLATANWLTKSLDQRAQTILKVATEIVRQQDGFLVHGVTHLRPMTLKLVAEAIDMHESTVSRVTSNKYVATPRGVFEMKYFFTTALGSSQGEADHSAESVRHRIRQLVEAEAANDVLSDDTIADLLHKEQGVEVARRTVAKYREGMNIPSSVIRRRQKRELAAVR